MVLFLCLLLSFAAAQSNPPRGELRLVILSDFNGAYGSTRYRPMVHQAVAMTTEVWQPDLFLSAGDVIAGQSASLPRSSFAAMWAAFDRDIARPLREAEIPYAFTIGNHDGSSLRHPDGSFVFQRERAAARAYWQQPMYRANLNYVDRSDFPFNYSFVFGDIFFLVWDASSATITQSQRVWVRGQLSSLSATNAKLRIVLGHLPLYGISVDKNRPGEILRDGDALRQLLEHYQVDLYISGHQAAYYPAQRGALKLLHTGGIGARQLLGSTQPPRSTVTVLDINFDPVEIVLSTFDAATYERIDPETLPEQLSGIGGVIYRWGTPSPLGDVLSNRR